MYRTGRAAELERMLAGAVREEPKQNPTFGDLLLVIATEGSACVQVWLSWGYSELSKRYHDGNRALFPLNDAMPVVRSGRSKIRGRCIASEVPYLGCRSCRNLMEMVINVAMAL